MPSKKILRIRNSGHTTVISYFHLQLVCKSLSRKFLGLKLIQLDCAIIYTFIFIQLKKLEMRWMEPVACLLFNLRTNSSTCSVVETISVIWN